MHLVIHHLEFRQTDNLEGRLDEPTSEKVDSLGAVFSVSDIRALNADHFDDGLKDGGLEVSTGWQANADDSAA